MWQWPLLGAQLQLCDMGTAYQLQNGPSSHKHFTEQKHRHGVGRREFNIAVIKEIHMQIIIVTEFIDEQPGEKEIARKCQESCEYGRQPRPLSTSF